MIVCWPAVIRKRQTNNLVAAFWDFFPTFADITGQPRAGHLDGISFLAALELKGIQKQHDYLYSEFHENGGRPAVPHG